MEFFIDVDGVVLDFESAFIEMVRDQFIPNLPEDIQITNWDLVGVFGDLDIKMAWNTFVQSGRFQELQLLVNKDQFNELSSKYRVSLISNIPKEIATKRETNLKNAGLFYEGFYLGGHVPFDNPDYYTKPQRIEKIRDPKKEIVFLDDHPENCRQVKNTFPDSQVFLMTQTHNLDAKDEEWNRISDWNEFFEEFL